MGDTNTGAPVGITLYCPFCRETQATVALNMGTEEFTCLECNEEFTFDDVQALIAGAAKWAKVLKWVEGMPHD